MQLTSFQAEYDNALARAEEDSELVSQLRNQNSRLNAELQALKSKYDKEVMVKVEEYEETR